MQHQVPEIFLRLKSWKEDRAKIDPAYQHIQNMFKSVISESHKQAKEVAYPMTVESLLPNQKMNEFEKEIQEIDAEKELLIQQASQMRDEIRKTKNRKIRLKIY